MATVQSVKAKLQGLIDKSNATTGNSDKDLTSAVGALVRGYGNGSGGIGITRKHITGSGNATIDVQDQHVYYVDGYSNISVNLPSGDFTAHFFVKFPEDALSCSFNIPDGVATFGNDLSECDFGESWEISIDGVGGALALRKRGL